MRSRTEDQVFADLFRRLLLFGEVRSISDRHLSLNDATIQIGTSEWAALTAFLDDGLK